MLIVIDQVVTSLFSFYRSWDSRYSGLVTFCCYYGCLITVRRRVKRKCGRHFRPQEPSASIARAVQPNKSFHYLRHLPPRPELQHLCYHRNALHKPLSLWRFRGRDAPEHQNPKQCFRTVSPAGVEFRYLEMRLQDRCELVEVS